MRRLGHLAVSHLLQGVQAVAVGVEGVHQMHLGGLFGESVTVTGDFMSCRVVFVVNWSCDYGETVV